MVSDQMIGQDLELVGYVRGSHIDRPLLVVLNDRIAHTETGNHPHDKEDQKDPHFQTSQEFDFMYLLFKQSNIPHPTWYERTSARLDLPQSFHEDV